MNKIKQFKNGDRWVLIRVYCVQGFTQACQYPGRLNICKSPYVTGIVG